MNKRIFLLVEFLLLSLSLPLSPGNVCKNVASMTFIKFKVMSINQHKSNFSPTHGESEHESEFAEQKLLMCPRNSNKNKRHRKKEGGEEGAASAQQEARQPSIN